MLAFATKLSKYVLYLSLHHSELYSITPESFLSTVTKPERGFSPQPSPALSRERDRHLQHQELRQRHSLIGFSTAPPTRDIERN